MQYLSLIMFIVIVTGLRVSRNHIPAPLTDVFEDAWTDDETMIIIDVTACTFLDIHALLPPVTKRGLTGDDVYCTTLGDDIICATLS